MKIDKIRHSAKDIDDAIDAINSIKNKIETKQIIIEVYYDEEDDRYYITDDERNKFLANFGLSLDTINDNITLELFCKIVNSTVVAKYYAYYGYWYVYCIFENPIIKFDNTDKLDVIDISIKCNRFTISIFEL